MLLPVYAASDDSPVTIVSSSENRSLYNIAKSISRKLGDLQIRNDLVDTNDSTRRPPEKSKLIVSVGNKITETSSRQANNIALLAITTKPLKLPPEHAQLVIQQPLCRQFKLIKALSDKFRDVAIISSSAGNEHTLKACASRYGLNLTVIVKQPYESLSSAIHRALQSDIILALPDSKIYNSRTVKSVLLQAYRKRIPLVGFSKSFVSAGALAALYTSSEQIANQASKLIQLYVKTGQLPHKPVYPDKYDVLINEQVSKSLQLHIPEAASIHEQLMKDETQ